MRKYEFTGSVRQYAHNGLAGCVWQKKNGITGHIVGLYNAEQAELDATDGPWVTLCETHRTRQNHRSLSMGRACSLAPLGWCEGCRKEHEERCKAVPVNLPSTPA
jgi:hypothetical protein